MTCTVTVNNNLPGWVLFRVAGEFRRKIPGTEPFKHETNVGAGGSFKFVSQSGESFKAISLSCFVKRLSDGRVDQAGATAPLVEVPNQDFHYDINPFKIELEAEINREGSEGAS